jgi:hypothetical protein
VAADVVGDQPDDEPDQRHDRILIPLDRCPIRGSAPTLVG